VDSRLEATRQYTAQVTSLFGAKEMEVFLVVRSRFTGACPCKDIGPFLQDEKLLLLLTVQGVPAAAKHLGVSERTVHRAAAAAGTNVRALVARFQRKVAERLLGKGRSIEEVAAALGYAYVTSLNRFISKEYGIPPSVLRRRLVGALPVPTPVHRRVSSRRSDRKR